ncbi:SixA phosphatase family protein [Microbacterium sp. NIBRBAC000506063]|uniref:SixA phosphatase family protein n=1 Tax=Microbacterium sp. NIBRBAC000506063 TaxID=2734618 RepID=UPI001BB5C518|nr:histidine phosphatase family protein [Microbacterium sp. NIBRBAC000506063]QTV79966.1 histidine phosphatase family protein [Microbacterium sp. NIBRBAC000506063]
MIELVLVRHAKSDWGDPALADHDRPLNARGESDAPVMAARLAEQFRSLSPSKARPERILSSTALRARTTAAAFGEALGVEVELDENLYGAPARVLLETAAASGASSVLIVAHDPGMTVLAEALSDGGIGHMPTCAVARFVWNEDDWDVAASVDPESWEFSTPR